MDLRKYSPNKCWCHLDILVKWRDKFFERYNNSRIEPISPEITSSDSFQAEQFYGPLIDEKDIWCKDIQFCNKICTDSYWISVIQWIVLVLSIYCQKLLENELSTLALVSIRNLYNKLKLSSQLSAWDKF